MDRLISVSVDAALQRIIGGISPLPAVKLPLLDAVGLTLAETIIADTDIPPFRNSAMDGYAVRAGDVAGACAEQPVSLWVIADIAAGHPCDLHLEPGQAARIMTGAPVPLGADTVVRFEDTSEALAAHRHDPTQVVVLHAPSPGDNVRAAGEDVRAGQAILPAGTPLQPAAIGVLAALGRAHVRVHRRPRVAIIATGDEVVGLDVTPGPGQIRDSNSYTLACLVRAWGGEPTLLGIAADRLAAVRRLLADARPYDLVVSSAGVSVGDFDVVKTALRAEGRIELWQVNMKPGKPLAFGWLGRTPFLGLPGNPVAAMVSMTLFGRPLVLRLLGRNELRPPMLRARALDRLDNGSARRHYVRVHVERQTDGGYGARMVSNQGSGVLTSMIEANGLAIVPEGVTAIPAGQPVEVLLLDWPLTNDI
jgi:molybdopterin molybdotransferase